MEILVGIDIQNDFINGSLGSEEAISVIPNIVNRIKTFKGKKIFTQDTHDINYLDTFEGKKLPIYHCIKYQPGWHLHKDIKNIISSNDTIIQKSTFGSMELINYISDIKDSKDKIDQIELIGFCTDICIISNAILLKNFFPTIPILVNSLCCAGTTRENHINALKIMDNCQINIINN